MRRALTDRFTFDLSDEDNNNSNNIIEIGEQKKKPSMAMGREKDIQN